MTHSSVLHLAEEQMQAYVGADWCSKRLVCATAVGTDQPRPIAGTKPRLSDVKDLLHRVRERHPDVDEVHVLIEGGAKGWIRLLHAAGAVVHVVDPKQAKKYAESLGSSGAKDDRRDARTLTNMLRSPAHCPGVWAPSDDTSAELRELAAEHDQLTNTATRLKQRLRDRLREHMPLVNAQLTNLDARWVRTFLRAIPTPWHARELTAERLTEVTPRCRCRDGLLEAIRQTQAPWLTQDLAEAEGRHLRLLIAQLEVVLEQLAEVDGRLDELTRGLVDRELLESVESIGLQQAVALLVFAFGGPLAHRDHAATQMGAAPVFIGSGETGDGQPKGRSKMRRSASAKARKSVYLLGRLAVQHLGWAKAMFQDGRARSQKVGTVYRRIARSLLRILTAMVRDQQPYDDARYVASLKANRVPWARHL